MANEQKKKLLYFMSVDWNWIAQRPHFMALELAKEYDVTVLYPRYLYRPWKGQQNVKAPEKCYGVPQIPFQEKFRVLRRLGNVIFRKYIGSIHDYDVVWMGTPMFARLIPGSYRGLVVYDYMDDIAALQSDERVAAYVRRAHAFLLRRADLIMVTSQYLMDGLDAGSRKKAYLVRNAFRGGSSPADESAALSECAHRSEQAAGSGSRDGMTRVGYVGTISGWMDFPLLLESLTGFPELEYHLWGPAGVPVPEHERLICHGVIEHDRIREAIADMDCLIMPFRVNDIVLAVDPVKLYEYISFGKNVICVQYPEVERFEPYVWFYHDEGSFEELLEKLVKRELKIKYDAEQQKRFLEMNSWEERGAVVRSLLNAKAK